jgi:DUF4097 and DUF4098 domain-containing protein YvlB
MQSLRSRLIAVVSLVVVTSALSSAATPQGTFDRSYPVSGTVDLQVFTHSGDISVHKGPDLTVSIKGKIFVGNRWVEGDRKQQVAALEQNPPIRQTGNSILVDYVQLKNIAIDYEITVPANTIVKTKSGSGDQTVEGTEGAVDVATGSGDVRLRDIKGNMQLRTGSGDVEADHLTGALQAEAGSGNMRLADLRGGDDRLRTGSGDIEIREVNASLAVQTGSGDLRAEGVMAGPWELRTGSGDIELRLPSQANFELDATTSSGSVVVDHPLTMTVQGNLEHSHKNVRGTVGSGGLRLAIHTGSGDVHIQ